MGIVATFLRLASSFVVAFGRHGDVTQYAHQRGVRRQTVYRESRAALAAIEGSALQAKLAATAQHNRARFVSCPAAVAETP